MPTVRVRGIDIYYEVQGEGFPLVLIGGLGASVDLHRQLIAGLAGSHRVVAFDNRGAGRSEKPDVPYTIPMMGLDTLALMDALGIGEADVLGISMGGRIALEIATEHPARVRRLVLVSTSAAGRGRIRMSLPMRLMSLLLYLPGLRRIDPQPRYAHLRQRNAATTYDGTAQLPRLHAPTLITHGRRDRSIPLARAEELHHGIPGSQFEVFDGGHMFCLLTEREKFLERVRAFLPG